MKIQNLIMGIILLCGLYSCNTNTNHDKKNDKVVSQEELKPDTCILELVEIAMEEEAAIQVDFSENNKVKLDCRYYIVEYKDKDVEGRINEDIVERVKSGLYSIDEDTDLSKSINEISNNRFEELKSVGMATGITVDFSECMENNPYFLTLKYHSVLGMAGEAHPLWGDNFVNYDLSSGRVFNPLDEFQQPYLDELYELILLELNDDDSNSEIYLSQLKEKHSKDIIFNGTSYFDNNGFNISYGPYNLGSYAERAEVFISKDVIQGFIKKSSVVNKIWE